MIGRQSRQMARIFIDIESLIPENHLLYSKIREENQGFFPDFAFCQQVQLLTVP